MNLATILCIIALMLYVTIRCNSNGSRLTKELVEIFYKDGKQVITIQEKISDFAKSSPTQQQGQPVNPMQQSQSHGMPQGQQRMPQGMTGMPGGAPKAKAYNVFSDRKQSSQSRVNAINRNVRNAQTANDVSNAPNVNGMNIPQMTNTSLNEIANKSNNFVVNNVKKNVQPKYKRN